MFPSFRTKRIDGLTVKQFNVASTECIPCVSLEDFFLSIMTSTMKDFNTVVCHDRHYLTACVVRRPETAKHAAQVEGQHCTELSAAAIPHQETTRQAALHGFKSHHFLYRVTGEEFFMDFLILHLFFRLKTCSFSAILIFSSDQQSSRLLRQKSATESSLNVFLWPMFTIFSLSLLEAASFISRSPRRGHLTLLP